MPLVWLTDATEPILPRGERQDGVGEAVGVQVSKSAARPTHDEKGGHDRDPGPSLETVALAHRLGHTVAQVPWRREIVACCLVFG